MEYERVQLLPRTVMGAHGRVTMGEVADFLTPAFDLVSAEMDEHGVEPSGPPVAVYRNFTDGAMDVTAGFVVPALTTPRAASVIETLPGGLAITATFVGPYDALQHAHEQVNDHLAAEHLVPAGFMWEEYLVGPGSGADPATWQTRLVYPLA